MARRAASARPAEGERTVEVESLASSGDGVGRSPSGQVVFLPYTAPGERVKARVRDVRARWAKGDLVEILRPSPERVVPPCPVFGRCGGCTWQHLSYPAQLAAKERIVRDALERVGGFRRPVWGGTVRPIVGADPPWRYRNKAVVPVGGRPGRLVAGYFARGTHRIVPHDDCLIEDPRVARAVGWAVALLRATGVAPYDESTHTGLVRHVAARVSRLTGEVLVVLVLRTGRIPDEEGFARALVERVPELAGIVVNEEPERTNRIFGRRTRLLWGKPYLVEGLLGLRLRVSATSFLQVNVSQAERLFARALEYARTPPLAAGARVLDAYCGVGALALLFAREAPEGCDVLGLDVSREAVRDARANARAAGLPARFEAAPVETRLPELVAQGWRPDLVFLDPPRSGARPEALAAVLRSGCPRVVYVSCNPATLARDAARLAEGGLVLSEVTPVDLFPQTAHVECVALFTREGTGSR